MDDDGIVDASRGRREGDGLVHFRLRLVISSRHAAVMMLPPHALVREQESEDSRPGRKSALCVVSDGRVIREAKVEAELPCSDVSRIWRLVLIDGSVLTCSIS